MTAKGKIEIYDFVSDATEYSVATRDYQNIFLKQYSKMFKYVIRATNILH